MRSDGFRDVSDHLVLLPPAAADEDAVVSETCQITWFSYKHVWRDVLAYFSETCQITWFSYASMPRLTVMTVSGPRQITWFSYAPGPRSRQRCVSEPCQITWFSYTSGLPLQTCLFQSRVRSPGSLTRNACRCHVCRFRAVSNHLVLLLERSMGGNKICFRAVPNHLVLLPGDNRRVCRVVSEPC